MKRQLLLPIFLSTSLLLSACQNGNAGELTPTTSTTSLQNNIDTASLFSNRDMEVGYEEESAIPITCSGNSITCTSDAVVIEGTTITIQQEGTYLLSGSLDDGMIIVDAPDTAKIQIVLNNASIHCSDCAALYVRQADKVFVTTAADSQNTLSSGDTFVLLDDNNIDGTIFSKCDLTLNGLGSLTISSPAGHGIVTKDDLVITSGTYDITAAGHGLSGKDSVAIANGTFTMSTGKDGVQSDCDDNEEKGFVYLADGTYTITAQGDGFSASTWMQVDGGTYVVTTGGGSANGETHTNTMQPGGGMMRGQRPGMDNMQLPQEGTSTDGSFDMQRPTQPQGMEPPAMPDNGEQEAPLPADIQEIETQATQTDSTADTTSTKGWKAGTMLLIQQGNFTADCADDAFHSNGDLGFQNGTAQIQTGDDAFHADNLLQISGGDIDITTCYEGLEGLTVDILDGTIDIVASDDGINAAGGADQSGMFGDRTSDSFSSTDGANINIAGGHITINCNGDGIDSNGDLTVSGGVIYVSASENGADSALDYDGSASITGGTLIGISASGMAQNFGSSSTQGSILLNVEAQSANSNLSLQDAMGNSLLSWTAPKGYGSVVISCPELEADGSYIVVAGDNSYDVTLEGLLYGQGNGAHAAGGRGNKQPRT